MKKVNKSFIIGIIIAFFGFITFAYGSGGYIGSLFFPKSGSENGSSVVSQYRLNGNYIADGTVTEYELSGNSVKSSHIQDNSIEEADLADDSVGSDQIKNGQIQSVDLAPGVGGKWNSNGMSIYYNTGNIGVGTSSPSAKLEVTGGAIKATDGLIIETRGSDPTSPVEGQMWLIQ